VRRGGGGPAQAGLWRGRIRRHPVHYLALIETKPNALDQAAALQGWELPEVF